MDVLERRSAGWSYLAGALALQVAAGVWGAPALAGQAYTDAEIRKIISPDEQKIREIREQEIAQLKLTLSRRIPEERRADLYLRLAEIYIEAYRAEFLLEGRAHELRLELKQEDKFIDRSRSVPYLKAAIAACQEIVDFGVKYERMDQVYYFLGYNYSELGEEQKAREYYSKIIQRFPRSAFAVEAYKELGEVAFNARDYRTAETYFENALASSAQAPGFESQVPRVRHRLAWCRYRQKQYERAVAEMKEAIRLATAGKEKLLSIREEALRDLAIFMTESGNVQDAVDYFQRTAGNLALYPKILEGLGRQYERNVEPDKAIQVYESLLITKPKDEAAFRFRVKLVDLDLRKGLYDHALGRVFGKENGKEDGDDIKLYPNAEGETETAWQNLRAMIRRTGTENHEKYRKSSDRKALEVAEKFYTAYIEKLLSLADPRKERPEIQMYLADVKRELGKAKEASELYKLVIASEDKRYAKEAAALWTASLADAIKRDNSAQKNSIKLRTEPTPLERDFVKSADDLVESIEGTIEAREAEMRSAQVLAGYEGSREEAIVRLKKIMKKHPKTGQGVTAARLWIQLYSDKLADAEKKDKSGPEAKKAASDLEDQLEKVVEFEELMAYDGQTGGKIRALVADYRERLKVMKILFYERDGDLKKAARAYEKFAEEAEQKAAGGIGKDAKAREAMSKAFENAVATYLRMNDMEDADRVLGVWQKKLPESQAAAQAMRNSATLLFVQGKFEGSAAVLERLGLLSKDSEALESAIRIFEAVDRDEQRVALVAQFVRTFPQAPGRARVAAQLAKYHESKKRDALAAQSYKECMGFAGSEEEVECTLRLGQLQARIGLKDEAIGSLKKAASSAAKGPSAFFVSVARWELARAAEAQILADKSQSEKLLPENLAKLLPKRLQNFELLTKALAPVLEIGGPYSVQASYKQAKAALDLAAEMEAVAPEDKTVKQASAVLRSKAGQILKQQLTKAQESEWLSPDISRVMGELAFLERSVRAQGTRPVLRWMDPRGSEKQFAVEKIREALVKNARDAAFWARYGVWLATEQENLALASIALDRAFALEPKNAAIINNIALLKELQYGLEEPYGALQVNAYLKQAIAVDDAATIAKANRAQLLNYYLVFAPAKKLWEQVLAKDHSGEGEDGLATALQGLGNPTLAKSAFVRAQLSGGDARRFAQVFQTAAAAAPLDPAACLDQLGELRRPKGQFEKVAAELLEEHCEALKKQKKNQPSTEES